MKTFIRTAHEEEYSNKSNTLGVLLNVDKDFKRIDSLLYVYRENRNMYIFFNTITDMNEFLLYGDGKMQRAYLSEEEFDNIYDLGYIEGKFTEHLVWTSKNTPQT
jgi:hypothetical protein